METVREALSNVAYFLIVVLGALAVGGVLNLAGHAEWGRYFGYWGTLLIIVSFVHSARKRKLFSIGRPSVLLRIHEFLAWLGATMVLVHGGIQLNAPLPWLAMVAMLVAVASGLTGKYLLKKSKIMMSGKKQALLTEGLAPGELEDRLYWESLVFDLMRKWRRVHLPITATFAFLALLHVVSILIFWRW